MFLPEEILSAVNAVVTTNWRMAKTPLLHRVLGKKSLVKLGWYDLEAVEIYA